MDVLDEIIETSADEVQRIFNEFGITAPVNKKNLRNAIVAVPGVNETIVSRFDGYSSDGDSNNDEGLDNATGKKEKRKAKLKKAVDTAGKVVTKATELKAKAETATKPEEVAPKPEPKKIFGLSPLVFWSVLIIVILIIVFAIVKLKK